jgi:hypothetical protein
MTTTPVIPNRPSAPSARRPWSGARTALIVVGVVVALVGGGALAGGGVALWAANQRDSDGFITAGPGRFNTDSYAISAPSVHVDVTGPDAFYDEDPLGEVRFQVVPAHSGGSVFVGIGRADDVAAYLGEVRHDEVSDFDTGPFSVTYGRHPGGAPSTDPTAQSFWVASDAGRGARTLTWNIAPGDWTVVIMNVDASAGIQVDVSTGAKIPFLGVLAATALGVGGMLLAAGAVMVVAPIATRTRRRPPADSSVS